MNWFGLPSDKDMTRPDDMPEKYWAMVFDAHLKRYNALCWGIWVGLGITVIVSTIFRLFA